MDRQTHWQRYKWLYVGLAAGVILGAMGVLLYNRNTFVHTKITQIFCWKPTTTVTVLERRGHPGWVTRCVETGEVYASQARAAACNNISPSRMSAHLNGQASHANGLHFERLYLA